MKTLVCISNVSYGGSQALYNHLMAQGLASRGEFLQTYKSRKITSYLTILPKEVPTDNIVGCFMPLDKKM